jgi:hypothetical protein
VRRGSGDRWEDEPYWIAAEALPALTGSGAAAAYVQVSSCAGVYQLAKSGM